MSKTCEAMRREYWNHIKAEHIVEQHSEGKITQSECVKEIVALVSTELRTAYVMGWTDSMLPAKERKGPL